MQKRKAIEGETVNWKFLDQCPLGFLIDPTPAAVFFEEHWEKAPKHYKATSDRRVLFPQLSTLELLKKVIKKNTQEEGLEFGVDLNAARYKNGKRETLNAEELTLSTVTDLYDKGCTLQWHQPQRWISSLWRLIAALETELCCLVGANSYITPPGTQGLAPHYDDVELWVCQTEGRKQWRLYRTPGGYELPADPSNDFAEEEIGEPILDVIMEVGDVLYMPRGTIHQAVNLDAESSSCHVTISTYQHWSLADYAQTAIQELLRGHPPCKGRQGTPMLPLALRNGLPIGFLRDNGAQGNPSVAQDQAGVVPKVAKQAAQGLRALATQLESEAQITFLVADNLAVDFIKSRAPPHPDALPDKGPTPNISSLVCSLGTSYFRLLPCQNVSPDIIEAYGEESSFVRVLSSLKNSISDHMMRGGMPICQHDHAEIEEEDSNSARPTRPAKKSKNADEDKEDSGSEEESDIESEDDDEDEEEGSGELIFPQSHAKALAQLIEAKEPISVRELKLKNKEEKVGLAYSLWEEGIIYSVSPATSTKKQKA